MKIQRKRLNSGNVTFERNAGTDRTWKVKIDAKEPLLVRIFVHTQFHQVLMRLR